MKPEDYSAHKGFVNRLKYIGENTGAKTVRSLAELLYGHYPDLNYKEFAICRTIADTLWDLEGPALLVEVQARAEFSLRELFEDTGQINDVIKCLAKKGIVRLETIYAWYGTGKEQILRPERVLKLGDNIEKQIHEIISKEFDSITKEAFAPLGV